MSNHSWARNKEEHNEIISHYLTYTMKVPCHHFGVGIEAWGQDGFQECHLSCPHGNRCHYAHKLPGSTRRFWFSTARIHQHGHPGAHVGLGRLRALCGEPPPYISFTIYISSCRYASISEHLGKKFIPWFADRCITQCIKKWRFGKITELF